MRGKDLESTMSLYLKTGLYPKGLVNSYTTL